MTSLSLKLNTGAYIPIIGLGTWQSPPEQVTNAVTEALNVGYRHLDCAWAYGNEKAVGEGIKLSGVPRSEIFITSKVWPTRVHNVESSLDETLENLGTDYLDLYLVHLPFAMNPKGNHPVFPMTPEGIRDIDYEWKLTDTWKQMEAMAKKGKVKAIGVSNFSQPKLEEILSVAEIIPAVDQLELHIYNPQHKLVEYLKSKGIIPQAFSPLGSTNSPLHQDEVVLDLAQRYRADTAHILLAYLVCKDMIILPKSVTPSRIAANLRGTLTAIHSLTREDIERLDGLAAVGKQKRFFTPPWPRPEYNLQFDDWPPFVPPKQNFT